MNARQVYEKVSLAKRIYDDTTHPLCEKAQEAALVLAEISENLIRRKVHGISFIEPDFRKAAEIYENLYHRVFSELTLEDRTALGRVLERIG